MIEIHLILIFMIAAAVIAVEAKDLISSVIAVGAVGIGLSLSFLMLKAPDLAIMQLVVEILSLIILIRGTIRRDLPFSTSGRWYFNTIVTLTFIAVFLGLSAFVLKNLPALGDAPMRVSKTYLAEGQVMTGAKNMVSAIILNFRAYDTLGEVTMIFTAIIGVLVIARESGKKET
jgi:multicomponent Na+:H+ antiporter subunit B